jgi:hypothetical protein
MCSAAAARPKCRRSATAKKYRNCHNSGRSIPIGYYSRIAMALERRPPAAHNSLHDDL